MSRIGDLGVRFHAVRVARRYGVGRGDPRLAEIERDALVLVREGARAREAVELAAVPILRVYGLPPRRGTSAPRPARLREARAHGRDAGRDKAPDVWQR